MTTSLKPIYIFSHARVSSNLFVRLISEHPKLAIETYIFDEAFMWGPERLTQRQTPQLIRARAVQSEENRQITYQMAFDRATKHIAESRGQGKIPVFKDHAYFLLKPEVAVEVFPSRNQRDIVATPKIKSQSDSPPHSSERFCPIILPPDFLLSVNPVLLIRDPIRFIPSYYRAGVDSIGVKVGDEDWPINASLKTTRLLYDWYRQQGVYPLVVDALELVHDTENVVKTISKVFDVEIAGMITNWSEAKPAHDSGQGDAWLASLSASTGIDPSFEPKDTNLDDEFEKWASKWGEHVASGLRDSVKAAQEDYLYLRQNSILVFHT